MRSGSLTGSRDAATANVVLALGAAHVALVRRPLVKLDAASVAISERASKHVSIRVALAELELVSIRASRAVDTEVEIAHLIARVAPASAADRKVRSARVANERVAPVDVDLACVISPLLGLAYRVKLQRVTVETCVRSVSHLSSRRWSWWLRSFRSSAIPAEIVVTVCTMAPVVSLVYLETISADVTEQTRSCYHIYSRSPREGDLLILTRVTLWTSLRHLTRLYRLLLRRLFL